jgi:superoxide dismutase, Cu-Zn family
MIDIQGALGKNTMAKIGIFVVVLSVAGAARAATAMARVAATSAGSSVYGTVKFEDTSKGLKVTAELSGVPPGDHGFHIHEFGSCGDAGKEAGSHYNPEKTPHGDIVKNGHRKAHIGDMGNITAGADGKAVLSLVIPTASVHGKNPVAGRAVILHEKADDFSQPVGNAGGRIGCGTIFVTGD